MIAKEPDLPIMMFVITFCLVLRSWVERLIEKRAHVRVLVLVTLGAALFILKIVRKCEVISSKVSCQTMA